MLPLQQDVEFLEHFGVKGMKWGVRKERSPADQARHDRRVATAKSAAKKAAIVGGVTAVALGAAVASIALMNRSNVSVSSIKKSASTKLGNKVAEQVITRVGKGNANSRPKRQMAPKVSAEHKAFIKAFSEKQTAINRAANADLREADNRLGIPIPLRTYLPDWS